MSFRLSLAISRNEFNHAVLACRSTENCQHTRIIRALGWTNDHVYAETPDWVIRRLSQVPIQTALFQSADAERQPPHPNPLPVGARATSGSDRPTAREDTVRFSSPPGGEDGRRPGEGAAAIPAMLAPDLGVSQQGEGEAPTE